MMGQGIERVRKVARIQVDLEKLANGIYMGSFQKAPYKETRIKTSSLRVKPKPLKGREEDMHQVEAC